MARLVYASSAFKDLERILDFLAETAPHAAADALARISGAVSILAAHPLIGRRVDRHRRELVISHGPTGYLALYRFDAGEDVIRILHIRHQRKAGYRG